MMLVPAILYKDEIIKKFLAYRYTEDMLFYAGWLGDEPPSIDEDFDGSRFQYAVINDGAVTGYLDYTVDWYVSCARSFGMFSFDRKNPTLGFDMRKEVKKLINQYHIHRMEWRMVGGNPIEKHYDKFCQKYGGKKFVLTDAVKDKNGKYHDDIIYEIIFDKGTGHKAEGKIGGRNESV